MQACLLRFLLILALLFSLAGCATTTDDRDSFKFDEEETYTSAGLAVNPKLRFSDLPVPAGFKLIKDKSFVFQTEQTRVALLKYSGRAKLQDLVDFYKEQMSLYNWQLLNVVEYGKTVLNFERAEQSCIVTIEAGGMKQIISICVAPKSKRGIEVEASQSK